jgi:hypothetical protein
MKPEHSGSQAELGNPLGRQVKLGEQLRSQAKLGNEIKDAKAQKIFW